METEIIPALPEAERRLLIKLMRRVSRNSELAGVIDRKTGDLRNTPDAVPILCSVLKNSAEYNWRSRTVALHVLRYLPIPPENAAEIAKVTGQILNGSDTSTPQRWMMRGLFIAGRWCLCVLPLALAFPISCLLPPAGFAGWLFIVYLALCGLFFAFGTFVLPLASPVYDAVRANDVRIEAAKTLASLLLPESVGALARAARGVNFRADIARNALLQLLPALTDAHYGQVGADATPELCTLLTFTAPDTPYMDKILAAIASVGDGRAVVPLENFAAYYSTLRAGKQAQEILPLLRQRRDRENASSMLLRHSSAPPAPPAELLRAASAPPETPPDQLLRPASEE